MRTACIAAHTLKRQGALSSFGETEFDYWRELLPLVTFKKHDLAVT